MEVSRVVNSTLIKLSQHMFEVSQSLVKCQQEGQVPGLPLHQPGVQGQVRSCLPKPTPTSEDYMIMTMVLNMIIMIIIMIISIIMIIIIYIMIRILAIVMVMVMSSASSSLSSSFS